MCVYARITIRVCAYRYVRILICICAYAYTRMCVYSCAYVRIIRVCAVNVYLSGTVNIFDCNERYFLLWIRESLHQTLVVSGSIRVWLPGEVAPLTGRRASGRGCLPFG